MGSASNIIEAMQEHSVDPLLPLSDILVLDLLFQDLKNVENPDGTTENSLAKREKFHLETITHLESLNDENDTNFIPTVFTNWDQEDFHRLPKSINNYILQPYICWARTIVRRQTDVVFLTHIILYLSTSLPSAILLYYYFTWPHAFLHWFMTATYCGPFTLLLHNHVHNNGVLVKKYSLFDRLFPYVLEPLMGHTWHSYYYHHVKCHHIEGNGPEDISSTLRYQRDSFTHFLMYWMRFNLSVWLELPYYFIRKNKPMLAAKFFFWEVSSYAFIYVLATTNFYATLFALIIPFVQMRIGLMVGNWGQHALIDELDPESDYRSSITLIDVAVSAPFIANF